MKYLIVSVLCCLSFWATKAQEKIETDRPDQTETPYLVPKKFFQGEIGFNKEKHSSTEKVFVYPTALLKYGLHKNLEFRLETNVISEQVLLVPNSKKISGLVPVEIGAKVRFWEEKGLRPKTSIIAHLGLPFLSSKSFRTPHLSPSFRLTMQNAITEDIAIGYNVGAAWDGLSGTPVWLYTFAPGFNIGEKWYAYVEAFGFISKHKAPEHALDGGIAYFLTKDVKVDVSGGFGLSSSAIDEYIAIGFSFRFRTF